MNADDPSGTRAGAGPVAPGHPPFALFAVPIFAARCQGMEGQNGASRGAPAPAEGTTRGRTSTGHGRRGFCEIAQRPSRRVRPGRGHDPGKDGYRSRRTWFLRNCATTLPPGQAPLAGFGAGGARPGEGQAQVTADVVLRNCATTLPPGQAPPAGLGAGGGMSRGRTGTGRGGRVFAKLRNDPPAGAGSSCRVRHGRGHVPEKDGHRSRRPRFFCEIAQRPWPPPGQAPPAGLGAGGGMIRGDGHRSRRTGFLRNRATTLPPGQAPPAGFGTGRFSRNAQRPSGQVREGVRDATVRHLAGGSYERAGSLGPRTLTLVASRLDLSRKSGRGEQVKRAILPAT